MTRALDRAAFVGLLALAVTFGLGDIARVTPAGALTLGIVRALLPASIGLALLAAIGARRWPAFPRAVAWPMVTWFGVLLLSAALAPIDPLRTWSTLERPASGALLAWAIAATARTCPARWRALTTGLACGGLLVAGVGLIEATGWPVAQPVLDALHEGTLPTADVPRITATLSHPNLAAIVLELSLPLLVAWAWTATAGRRVVAALGVLAALAALLLTFSRAGLLAAVGGLGVMAALAVRSRRRQHALSLAVAALVLPLVLLSTAAADARVERRLSAGLDEATREQPSRLVFWEVALAMQADHPWLGVGPDNYRWQFATYSGIDGDNLGVHAHNQYLEALADTGVVGLVALGWLLLALTRTSIARALAARGTTEWAWRAALLGSLCAWLLHAGLDDFDRFWPASVAFWFVAGLSLAVEKPPAERDDRDHDDQDQHARRARQGPRATAAATEAHHRLPLFYSRARSATRLLARRLLA